MSLSAHYLEYGRHVARLRHRRAYAPKNNTASHDNHEKIHLCVSFSFLYGYGAPLGRRSSAKIFVKEPPCIRWLRPFLASHRESRNLRFFRALRTYLYAPVSFFPFLLALKKIFCTKGIYRGRLNRIYNLVSSLKSEHYRSENFTCLQLY